MVVFNTGHEKPSLEDISENDQKDMIRYFEEEVKKFHHHADGTPVNLTVRDASEIEDTVEPVKQHVRQALGQDYDKVRHIATSSQDAYGTGTLHSPSTFVFGCTACGEMFQVQQTAMGVKVYELDQVNAGNIKTYSSVEDVNLYAKTQQAPQDGQYDGNAKAKGYGGSYNQQQY